MVQRGHQLCHRGRGGLHPHRRGAHAADHLRRGRQVYRPVREARIASSAPCKRARSRRRIAGRTIRSRTKNLPRCARITSSTKRRRPCNLSEAGVRKAEQLVRRGEPLRHGEQRAAAPHQRRAAVRMRMMKRDVDYVVQNDEVVIVDEFTGRLMVGRRYSDGLHQAIEAKEHVKVAAPKARRWRPSPSRTTSACISKLSGMTGTAKTEEEEFQRHLSAGRCADSDQPPDDPQGHERRSFTARSSGKVQRRWSSEIANAATRPVSRCWSARFPSRSAKHCPRCCACAASSMSC